MNLSCVNVSIVFALLAAASWPVVADDARPSASPKKNARKRHPIILTSQLVEEDVFPLESPPPEVVLKPAADERDSTAAVSHARSWTLRELEAIANTGHPLLQREVSRIDSARGNQLQAGLYPNPRFDTNNPQVFTGQNTLLNAGIQQEFVVMGKKRLDRAAALKVVQQNEYGYVQTRFQLLMALRQQYYTVLAAERRVRALKRLQQITSESVETGKLQVKKLGDLGPIDVNVLELDMQRVESNLEGEIRLLRGARKQLAFIVGDQSISEDEFQGSIHSMPPQFDETTLNEFVSLSSAPIEIQRREIERNEILLQRAIVEPYPNINLGPAMQWGLTNGSEQYWMTVTFPIPTWDRNQGNIQAQRAELVASRQQLAAMQLEQLRRVADAYAQHRAVRIRAEKYKNDLIPNSWRTLKIARKAYFGGEYDFPRYLQIQRTFVEFNMEYIDLLENVWTSAAQLSGLLQLEEFL
jgi:outer membrane protein, heavy metal efflux system